MTDDLRVRLMYIVIGVGAPLLYVLLVRPKAKAEQPDRILEMNARLLVAAFALVVSIALVIAQLASSLGIGRGVRPVAGILWHELLGFFLAIGITLIARWLRGKAQVVLMHFSCVVTLTCFLLLPPYFWHQRRHISTQGILDDAFSEDRKNCANGNILDVLVSAARKGNYMLLRDGVARLRDSAANCGRYRDYLDSLNVLLSAEGGDKYSLEIVTGAPELPASNDVANPSDSAGAP